MLYSSAMPLDVELEAAVFSSPNMPIETFLDDDTSRTSVRVQEVDMKDVQSFGNQKFLVSFCLDMSDTTSNLSQRSFHFYSIVGFTSTCMCTWEIVLT
jgi:hypothetical protein